jgi:hypothetical protein
MPTNIAMLFLLVISFLPLNLVTAGELIESSSDGKTNIKFIEATGRASIDTPEDNSLARRRALEDAIYLAALQGGAKINGFSAVASGSQLSDHFVVRPTTQIVDYTIMSEIIKDTHYEVTINAAIGEINPADCKSNSISNLIAYKPLLELNPNAPAWLTPVLSKLYLKMLEEIEKKPNISLIRAFNTELNSSKLININDEYDYQSLTRGRIRTETGSYAYVPEIKFSLDLVNDSINTVETLQMQIKSNLIHGGNYENSVSKTHNIALKIGNRSPWRTINVLSKPSVTAIIKSLMSAVNSHINVLLAEIECQPLKATLRVSGDQVKVAIGQKHGLSMSALAFTKGNTTPWTLFRVRQINNNNSILEPLDSRKSLKGLNGKTVQFMENM